MDNLNIGGVPLKSHAVLAPMAGVSDRAYRELCVRFGAAYCVSAVSYTHLTLPTILLV